MLLNQCGKVSNSSGSRLLDCLVRLERAGKGVEWRILTSSRSRSSYSSVEAQTGRVVAQDVLRELGEISIREHYKVDAGNKRAYSAKESNECLGKVDLVLVLSLELFQDFVRVELSRSNHIFRKWACFKVRGKRSTAMNSSTQKYLVWALRLPNRG